MAGGQGLLAGNGLSHHPGTARYRGDGNRLGGKPCQDSPGRHPQVGGQGAGQLLFHRRTRQVPHPSGSGRRCQGHRNLRQPSRHGRSVRGYPDRWRSGPGPHHVAAASERSRTGSGNTAPSDGAFRRRRIARQGPVGREGRAAACHAEQDPGWPGHAVLARSLRPRLAACRTGAGSHRLCRGRPRPRRRYLLRALCRSGSQHQEGYRSPFQVGVLEQR